MVLITTQCFPKTASCVDILSFDPGLTNAGVAHIRVNKETEQCCILHGAIVDVLHPQESFSMEKNVVLCFGEKKTRKRKPERVEPFSHTWPDPPDFQVNISEAHSLRLESANALNVQNNEKSNNKNKNKNKSSLTFPERIALLAWTLHSMDWLRGDTCDADVVLVEVQDPQNPQMRSVGHAIQAYYETENARRSLSSSYRKPCMCVQYVSSQLKLSDAVLAALDDHLDFQHFFVSGKKKKESLIELISRRSHSAKKASAVHVFNTLQKRALPTHPFFMWSKSQRTTKHNVFDALLQAWSWMLDKGVGFDPTLLSDTRKLRQRKMAAERRERQKQLKQDNILGGSSASKTGIKRQRDVFEENSSNEDKNENENENVVAVDFS